MEKVLAKACGVIDSLPSIARRDGANEKHALPAETGCAATSDRIALLNLGKRHCTLVALTSVLACSVERSATYCSIDP